MDARLRAFQEAAERAVEYQLQFQQPDGSFIWDDEIRDAYHKQPYAWGIAGRLSNAHRLLTWIADNTLQKDGNLQDYGGDVYKLSWLFQGAHRLGRFDISHPVMGWLMQQQKHCGGLPHFAADDRLRALATAWVGVSALYFGDADFAERCAHWCAGLLDQPDDDRFYFQTTLEGDLLTTEMDATAQFIDLEKTGQAYWEIGLPWMLMGRLYQATGEAIWLEYAEQFFEWQRSCAEDNFACVGSGKSSLAACIHYLNTADVRARNGAVSFGEFLLATQLPEGGWNGPDEPDTTLIYVDHAAEYTIWLREMVGILGSAD
ncbi:MAG: hypothetical protein ACOX9R_00330 [Armatimonadota bacterium]|jgi:hypothetical protein